MIPRLFHWTAVLEKAVSRETSVSAEIQKFCCHISKWELQQRQLMDDEHQRPGKGGTAAMKRGWGCNSGRFCRNLTSGPHFIRILWGLCLWARWLAFPVKATTYTLWWGLKVLGTNDWIRLIPAAHHCKDVKEAILCPSPSPCPYNSNAQHSRVCGVQPIQPSGLQQLQTGREPKQQQSGNEFFRNKHPKATEATW